MTFAGLVTHMLKSRQDTEVMSGVDKATERLKASMAAHAMAKDSNKWVCTAICSTYPQTVGAFVSAPFLLLYLCSSTCH